MSKKKKIVWVDLYTETIPAEVYPGADKIWPVMGKYLQDIAREDTELSVKFLKRSPYYVASSYAELLNNIEIVDAVIKAEGEGADAVIIGCAGDPALRQARETVDIPVIGLLESSMHIAATLGHKFAVVVPWEKLLPEVDEIIRRYGMQDLAISNRPARSFNVSFDSFEEQITNPRRQEIPAFETEALKCIADGAEVIIPACAYLGPGMVLAGYRKVGETEVPVIDITSAGVKMAEAMVELRELTGLSTSKHRFYRMPVSRELLDKYRAPFYARAVSSNSSD